MRINFRQISALATSALMLGLTAGTALAANYPAPFVVGGSADVAIVYGTGSGVSALDAVQAGNIQTNLQSFMTGTTGGTTTSTSGETVALDTSSTRIWLNTSLNTAKATLTSTDLPTVLADTEFSGNVDATLTHTLKMQAGLKTGTNGENSGRVIFAKQPKSSNDPVIGISLGTNANNILYNATVDFKAINFTHADSEGETVKLFGKEYVVSTATDATELVLFASGSAGKVTLTKTGTTNPTTTTTIGGKTYTVELLNGDSTTATISVDGETQTINEGSSKKVAGIEVAVIDVISSDAGGITATLLVGSERLTFTHGATVTRGTDDDPIDGTTAYLTGRVIATTSLTIAVYRPDSSNDAILEGTSFVDPVFQNFKVDFAGLNSPFDDATRDTITISNSGDDTMTIAMTDSDSNAKTIDFAHNQSGQWGLADDSNNTIWVREFPNVSQDEYLVVGNEEYGHLLELTDLFNSTNGDHTKHRAKFRDVFSGITHETTFTSDTAGTVIIDGKTYTITFNAAADKSRVQVKYPTADSSATELVLYPTIQSKRGANIALYEPLRINLEAEIGNGGANNITGFRFPDGDGYTSVAVDFVNNKQHSENSTWTIGGNPINLSSSDAGANNYTTVTIGSLVYNFTRVGPQNWTTVNLVNPESNVILDRPGVIVFEEKDDQSEFEAFVIDLETDPGATSTNGVGVNDVLGTAKGTDKYWGEASRASDSDLTDHVDWYGTLITINADDSDQKTAIISIPDTQVYAQIFIGEESSAVTGGTSTGGATQLGDVLVKDSEVSSVSSKNLVVVGGSCINSVAANLVGGAYCGSAWTDSTSVGSGQFLIQSFGDKYTTGKIALLVAGYEAADTVNAATYLRNQAVDTASGKKYVGTSATSAELQVA